MFFVLVIVLIIIAALLVADIVLGQPCLLDKLAGHEKNEVTPDTYPWIHLQGKDVHAALKVLSASELSLVTRRPYFIRNLKLTAADMLFDDFIKFIAVSPNAYWSTGWLSDQYNEECRVDCRRYDSDRSLRQAWERHGHEIVKKHPKDHRAQLDALYAIEFGCNAFRPDLVVGMIKFLNIRHLGRGEKALAYPARMLDFSAGWGDRLIGAIAGGIEYVGVDPNPCVHKGYARIIKDLGDPERHKVIEAPFEEVPEKDLGKVDFTMTSPPYFDLEVYANTAGQSIINFPSEKRWLEGFMFPTLEKCWKVLRPGGTMIIIINDKYAPSKGETGFTIPVRNYATKNLTNALYRGILPYSKEIAEKTVNGKHTPKTYLPPQPMFVWYKYPTLGPSGWFSKEYLEDTPAEWLGVDLQEALWGAPDTLAKELVGDKGLDRLRNSRPREITWAAPVETYNRADDPGITLGKTLLLGRTVTLSAYAPIKVLLNPPFTVENHNGFKIIRDDLLPGGTKQRGHKYIEDIPGDGPIVYAGTYGGFCHVAIGVSCWFHKRPLVAFLAKNDYPTNIIAKRFGVIIFEIAGATYPALKKYAMEWAESHGGTFFRGFYDDEYEKHFTDALRVHTLEGHKFDDPLVFWLGETSAVLAKALSVIYPRAFFNLVHLGKQGYNEDLPAEKTRVWYPEEDFLEPARDPPPYPSVSLYDAKIWAIAKANASAEDYIWNVGAE